MTPLETKQILSFIKNQFDITAILSKHTSIDTLTNAGFKFKGSNGLDIYLRGIEDNVQFEFKNTYENEKIISKFTLPLKECEDFLNYIFISLENSLYNKNLIFDGFIKEQLSYFKDYIKNVPYAKLEDNISTVLYIPNKYGHTNCLLFGLSNNFKKEVESVGYVEIPCNIFRDYSNNRADRVNLILPNWELHKYPILHDFVTFKKTENSFQEILEQLHQLSPQLSTELQYHILDSKIEHKNQKTFNKPKI